MVVKIMRMKTDFLLATIIMAVAPCAVCAGSISDGKWSPTSCGDNPPAPIVDAGSVAAFNQSLVAISDWQLKSRAYIECLVNEANTDNQLIANSANQVQTDFRGKLEKLSAEAKAASKALEQK